MDKKIGPLTLNLLLMIGVLMASLAFLQGLKDLKTADCVDLRHRIISVRNFMKGFDPYFTEQKIITQNYEVQKRIVANTQTAPPSVLFLYVVIAWMPYHFLKYLWFFFSWALMIGSIGLLARSAASAERSKLIWFISLFFICGSHSYRLYLERGQVYLVYVFMLSVAYWLLQKKIKYREAASGLVIGLLTSLRPTMIFMCVPMLIFNKRKMLIGSVAGVVLGIFFSLLTAGTAAWESYFAAMGQLNRFKPYGTYAGNAACQYVSQWGNEYADLAGKEAFSALRNTDSCVHAVMSCFFNKSIPSPAVLAVFLISMSVLCFLIYWYRSKQICDGALFLIGITLVIFTDHFVPMARWNYVDVLWIAPLSFVMISIPSLPFLIRGSTILLLLGLSLGTVFVQFDHSILISEFMMIGYFVVILFTLLRRKSTAKSAIESPSVNG